MNFATLKADGTQGSQVAAPADEVWSLPQGVHADAPDGANQLAGHSVQSDCWVALNNEENLPAGQGTLRAEPLGQKCPERQAWHAPIEGAPSVG